MEDDQNNLETETKENKKDGNTNANTNTKSKSPLDNSKPRMKITPVNPRSKDPTQIPDPLTPEEEDIKNRLFCKGTQEVQYLKIHCTSCNIHLGSAPRDRFKRAIHPLLRVIICKNCYKFYTSGEFDKDEDGFELYCRWCGQGGNVMCCSKCTYVFCQKCVRQNKGKKALGQIKNSEDWACFSCNPEQIVTHKLICSTLYEYTEKEVKLAESNPELRYRLDMDYSLCCGSKPAPKLPVPKPLTPKLPAPKPATPKPAKKEKRPSTDNYAFGLNDDNLYVKPKKSKKQAFDNFILNQVVEGEFDPDKTDWKEEPTDGDEVVCTPDLLSLMQEDAEEAPLEAEVARAAAAPVPSLDPKQTINIMNPPPLVPLLRVKVFAKESAPNQIDQKQLYLQLQPQTIANISVQPSSPQVHQTSQNQMQLIQYRPPIRIQQMHQVQQKMQHIIQHKLQHNGQQNPQPIQQNQQRIPQNQQQIQQNQIQMQQNQQHVQQNQQQMQQNQQQMLQNHQQIHQNLTQMHQNQQQRLQNHQQMQQNIQQQQLDQQRFNSQQFNQQQNYNQYQNHTPQMQHHQIQQVQQVSPFQQVQHQQLQSQALQNQISNQPMQIQNHQAQNCQFQNQQMQNQRMQQHMQPVQHQQPMIQHFQIVPQQQFNQNNPYQMRPPVRQYRPVQNNMMQFNGQRVYLQQPAVQSAPPRLSLIRKTVPPNAQNKISQLVNSCTDWFSKAAKQTSEINNKLANQLVQLSHEHKDCSSVEQMASVHNKLQELLSSSVNLLIQVRKNLRTDFLSDLDKIKPPEKPPTPISIQQTQQSISNSVLQIRNDHPYPQRFDSLSPSTYENQYRQLENIQRQSPMTPVENNTSILQKSLENSRPRLKVKSVHELYNVPSECITLPDEPIVRASVSLASEDPLETLGRMLNNVVPVPEANNNVTMDTVTKDDEFERIYVENKNIKPIGVPEEEFNKMLRVRVCLETNYSSGTPVSNPKKGFRALTFEREDDESSESESEDETLSMKLFRIKNDSTNQVNVKNYSETSIDSMDYQCDNSKIIFKHIEHKDGSNKIENVKENSNSCNSLKRYLNEDSESNKENFTDNPHTSKETCDAHNSIDEILGNLENGNIEENSQDFHTNSILKFFDEQNFNENDKDSVGSNKAENSALDMSTDDDTLLSNFVLHLPDNYSEKDSDINGSEELNFSSQTDVNNLKNDSDNSIDSGNLESPINHILESETGSIENRNEEYTSEQITTDSGIELDQK